MRHVRCSLTCGITWMADRDKEWPGVATRAEGSGSTKHIELGVGNIEGPNAKVKESGAVKTVFQKCLPYLCNLVKTGHHYFHSHLFSSAIIIVNLLEGWLCGHDSIDQAEVGNLCMNKRSISNAASVTRGCTYLPSTRLHHHPP